MKISRQILLPISCGLIMAAAAFSAAAADLPDLGSAPSTPLLWEDTNDWVDVTNKNEKAVSKVRLIDGQPWSPQLVGFLGGGILVFCLLVLLIASGLLKAKEADATTILKVFGLTLILCLSAFLMIVGYGQSQLTPIVGLFGAIAGYLLGKEKKEG